MRPRAKIWLETESGTHVMGPGVLRLLAAVRQEGSLKAGAKRIGVSYRKAWEQLKDAEATLGYPLLQRHSGGEGGGGSNLTPQADGFIASFERFRQSLEQDLQLRFQEAFGPPAQEPLSED